MTMKKLERLLIVTVVVFTAVALAACAIRLRGDEGEKPSATSADQASDPLATKLAECRSVTYEQKNALSECRKAWAEKRRQFLQQKAPSASFGSGASQDGSPLFVPLRDESRQSADYSKPQAGKE